MSNFEVMSVEEQMKNAEVKFCDAMNVLRLFNNKEWATVVFRDEERETVVLEQTVSPFVFEDEYEIDAYFREGGFYRPYRSRNKSLEVDERKFDDSYDYSTMHTQVSTRISDDIALNLKLLNVNDYDEYTYFGNLHEARCEAIVQVTIENTKCPQSETNDVIKIQFDTFKLKPREIRKVRSLIKNAITAKDELLKRIEIFEYDLERAKNSVVFHEKRLSELYAQRDAA